MKKMHPLGWTCVWAVLAFHPEPRAQVLDQFEARGVHNSLGENQPEWWEQSGLYRRQAITGDALELGLRRIEYFGIEDYEGAGEMKMVPYAGSSLRLRGTVAPDHLILPNWTGLAEWSRTYETGFGWGLGAASYQYTEVDWWTASGSLQYFSDSRLQTVYTIQQGYLSGGGDSLSHKLDLSKSYNDGTIGVILVTGEEATRVSETEVVPADVLTYALVGRHWLSKRWGVSYSAGRTDLETFFTRDEISGGLLFRF